MRDHVARALIWMLLFCSTVVAEESSRAMVATVHPLATRAGVNALRQGGNAVDAAVAAALTLGVVDGHNSGIGGGCFVLIRDPSGRFTAIDGRETAPQRATRDMFLRDGIAQPDLSTTGALASGTPGAVAAYELAVRMQGELTLSELLLPAAEIAEKGFPIDRVYAADLVAKQDQLQQFPSTRAVLLKEDGSVYQEGEVLKQPDLAATYRAIAEEGIQHFYNGPFAAATEQWMKQNGGILTRDDFARYEPRIRTPLVTKYREWQVVGFPPPSSGGVHVAQILGMLERFDLRELASEQDGRLNHVMIEAMKRAFADRAHWLGDADFANVPKGLVDRTYLDAMSQGIDLDRSTPVKSHGHPPNADSEFFDKHTTHVAAADADGYWVAITATVNTTFGSKVIIPGTGVVLNNEMDDFSIQPGIPNAFGLVGAEANAIAPGKRPLSSMSPTIVLREDRPVLTVGAAGGPTIINQVVLAIVRHLDLQMPLPQAVAEPRFHHQWSPDRVLVESRFPGEVVNFLERRGHQVETRNRIGVTQAIARVQGNFIGVFDPRVPGAAAGP